MTADEAKKALKAGKKVRHKYYVEWNYIDKVEFETDGKKSIDSIFNDYRAYIPKDCWEVAKGGNYENKKV